MKLSNKWKNKRRILAGLGAIALAIPPIVAIVSCNKPQPEPYVPIVEPTEEQKHKSPGIDIDEAEFKFELKKTCAKENINVFVTPANSNEDSEIDFSVVDVQDKNLICKAKWNKHHIVDTTYSFDVRFINNKDSWTQKIQGLSLEWKTAQTVTSIKYVEGSTKTTYDFGNALDTTGLTIEATSDTGAKELITKNFTTEPAHGDILDHSNYQITVTFTNKKGAPVYTTIPLTINAIFMGSSIYSERSFKVGETIHRDSITAKGNYSDGTVKDIKNDCVFPEIDAGYTFTKPGTFAFKAQWKEDPSLNTSFGVLVKEGDVQSLEIKLADPDKAYIVGDKVKKEDFIVIATCASGQKIILEKDNFQTEPEIPAEGLTLTDTGLKRFVFKYTNVESAVTVSTEFSIDVIVPLFKELEVYPKRRWYQATWWSVPLSDFDVYAIYSNIPARKLQYAADGVTGFKTDPVPNQNNNFAEQARSISKVTFTYKVGGIELTNEQEIKKGNNPIEGLEITVPKANFKVGEQLTVNDLIVYGKFKDVPDVERLKYDRPSRPEKWSIGYYTDPVLPYTFKPEDAGIGKTHIHVKTSDDMGARKDYDIANKITVENIAIQEINAYPRISEPWYVGQTLTRDDIVVDETYTSGAVAKDIKNWQSEEIFPLVLTDEDVPNKTIHISRYDKTCECNIPVFKSKGEKVDVRIDPTYAGLIGGKSFVDTQLEVGVTWGTIKQDFTQKFKPTPYASKRVFDYWSFSNQFTEIPDNYTFKGGEIITARYKDDVNLLDCACFDSIGESTITFGSISILDHFWYSIDEGKTWANPVNGEPIKIVNQKLYLRGENVDGMHKPINIKALGDVHLTGRLMALFDDGLITPTTQPENTSFEGLFKGSTGLRTVSRDILTNINTLYPSMFKETFAGCSNLIYCPDLPIADEIPVSCYQSTFEGCTNLISIPNQWKDFKCWLVIKNYQANCMNSMFKDCPSLDTPIAMTFNDSKFEPNCLANMYSGDFSVPACLTSETDGQPHRSWFKFPSSAGNIENIAKNMCPNATGVMFTPQINTDYHLVNYDKISSGSEHDYSIATWGAKYYRETVRTRTNLSQYEDPSIFTSKLKDEDEGNEWHSSSINDPGHRIIGNHICDRSEKNNDNYRQIFRKLSLNFIFGPQERGKVTFTFDFHYWMTSNSSIFGANTENNLGAILYRIPDINNWPDRMGDIFVKNWHNKYYVPDHVYSDYVSKALKKWSTYSQTLTFTITLDIENNTNYDKLFSLYYILSTGIDGNSFKVNGDKRGTIDTIIRFGF